MFSQELENLINATLEDGVLEDYEKAALVKRAQAEGVDLAELEIYINSILQKRQKEQEKEQKAKMEKHAQEKKEAFGRVCPSCGKQVPPLTLKCECGYEFSNSASVTSVQLLLEKIEDIKNSSLKQKEKEERIRDTIEMFPVPNTKEDIIEFLSLAVSNLNKKVAFINSRWGRILLCSIITLFILLIFSIFIFFMPLVSLAVVALIYYVWKKLGFSEGMLLELRIKSWRAKFDQVILKGRSMRGDPDFQRQLDYYENLVNR